VAGLGIASLSAVEFGGVIYDARERNDEVVGWFERIVVGRESALLRKPSVGEGQASDFDLMVGVLGGWIYSPQCDLRRLR
jgi:hypothetical protein